MEVSKVEDRCHPGRISIYRVARSAENQNCHFHYKMSKKVFCNKAGINSEMMFIITR
jgi:hypothetical protein